MGLKRVGHEWAHAQVYKQETKVEATENFEGENKTCDGGIHDGLEENIMLNGNSGWGQLGSC